MSYKLSKEMHNLQNIILNFTKQKVRQTLTLTSTSTSKTVNLTVSQKVVTLIRKHNERARVAPQDSFKDALRAQKKTQRAHHAHAPWLGVWFLARCGWPFLGSLAPFALILVLAL